MLARTMLSVSSSSISPWNPTKTVRGTHAFPTKAVRRRKAGVSFNHEVNQKKNTEHMTQAPQRWDSSAETIFLSAENQDLGGEGGGEVGRLGGWEVGRLGGWEVGRLGGWEVGRLGGWEVGRLGGWEVGRLGGWEVGRLGGWEVGRLGGWEVGEGLGSYRRKPETVTNFRRSLRSKRVPPVTSECPLFLGYMLNNMLNNQVFSDKYLHF